jgi:hypothetical protein
MARFQNTITYLADATDAQGARRHADTVVRIGTEHNYFADATVVSVEAYVAPRTYTQAEFDAAVLAAAENARQNALSGNLEG